MYHMIHVKMKIGKMSAPGISSIIEIKPTQPNIKTLAKIPAKSRKSPNNGSNRIATIYSLTSNSMNNESGIVFLFSSFQIIINFLSLHYVFMKFSLISQS